MHFESMIRTPEEVVAGNIFWSVLVGVGQDGSVVAAVPHKLIPRTDAVPVDKAGSSISEYYFGVRSSSGFVSPMSLAAFGVGMEEDSKAHDYTHSRLFRKRKDAILYHREMQDYKPTDAELIYIKNQFMIKESFS